MSDILSAAQQCKCIIENDISIIRVQNSHQSLHQTVSISGEISKFEKALRNLAS